MSKQIILMIFSLSLIAKLPAWGGEKKIVVVLSRFLAPYEEALEGFKETSRCDIRHFNMKGDAGRARQIMEVLSPPDTDLVVTIGSEATLAAQKYLSSSIPVVYTMVLEEQKFTGRRAAGVLMQVPIKEQLGSIQKLFAYVSKVGVIYNPIHSGDKINQTRRLITEFGMHLVPIAVENQQDITNALNKLTRDKIDLLWSVVDQTVAKPAAVKLVISHSLEEKIPFIGLSKFHVQAGALAAFSVDYKEIGAQTAVLARKVIQSKKKMPPVEFPHRVILFLNTQTWEKLGIKSIPNIPGIQSVAE